MSGLRENGIGQGGDVPEVWEADSQGQAMAAISICCHDSGADYREDIQEAEVVDGPLDGRLCVVFGYHSDGRGYYVELSESDGYYVVSGVGGWFGGGEV